MGCTTSKQAQLDRRRRFLAAHDNHFVTLTSSTLGSLQLDPNNMPTENALDDDDDHPPVRPETTERRTPLSSPETISGDLEVINAWELMEGLDDTDDSPAVSDFDSQISKSSTESVHSEAQDPPKSIVRLRIEAFQQKIDAKRDRKNGSIVKVSPLSQKQSPASPVPGGREKVVLYFTSLRGVRKTFEDCLSVKTILKSYGYRIDERDVSMHSGFREELVQRLGSVSGRSHLPRVFAGGRYVGGADEVKQLHEGGELSKALEGCEMMIMSSHKVGVEVECQGCGDVRFVPCEVCSGSCKLYVEEENGVTEFGSFRRCPECNENGLVRCPLCCC